MKFIKVYPFILSNIDSQTQNRQVGVQAEYLNDSTQINAELEQSTDNTNSHVLSYMQQEFIMCLKHYDLYPCTLEDMVIHNYIEKTDGLFHPFCCRISCKQIPINEYNQYGTTPLCLAVKLQRKDIIYMFLQNGADPNLAELSTSRSALMFAAYLGDFQVAEMLIKSEADVNHTDNSMITPLMMSCSSKLINLQVVKLLVENNADLHAQDKNGWSCLHYAVRSESEMAVEAIRYLLVSGADKKIRDHSKLTVRLACIYFLFD